MDPSEDKPDKVQTKRKDLRINVVPKTMQKKRRILKKSDSRGNTFTDDPDSGAEHSKFTSNARETFDLGGASLTPQKTITVDLTLISPNVVKNAVKHIRSWQYVEDRGGSDSDNEGPPNHPATASDSATTASVWTFQETHPGEFVATVDEVELACESALTRPFTL